MVVAGGEFVLASYGDAAATPPVHAAVERLAAFAIGSVAAFWVIDRTWGFLA